MIFMMFSMTYLHDAGPNIVSTSGELLMFAEMSVSEKQFILAALPFVCRPCMAELTHRVGAFVLKSHNH